MTALPSAIAGWVVLAIGLVRLALPQRDVLKVELSADLKPSATDDALKSVSVTGDTTSETTAGSEVSWLLRKDGNAWPAYNLDASLALQRPASADRPVCVFFSGAGRTLGVLCNRVWSLATDAELSVEPMPGCMTGPRTPTTGLARFEEGVALVTDGRSLATYLAELVEAQHGRSRQRAC